MDKIYILKRKNLLRGPYTVDALKQKGLHKYDLIWYKGLPDWTPAQQVDAVLSCIREENSNSDSGSVLKRLWRMFD